MPEDSRDRRTKVEHAYDEHVIRTCKELEEHLKELGKEAPPIEDGKSVATPEQWDAFSRVLLWLQKGALARSKQDTVSRSLNRDEGAAFLVKRLERGEIACNACRSPLAPADPEHPHLQPVSAFCPSCRRIVSLASDGRQEVPEHLRCLRCSKELKTTSATREGNRILLRRECTGCGMLSDGELRPDDEPASAALPPIHADDWKKFCMNPDQLLRYTEFMTILESLSTEARDAAAKKEEEDRQARLKHLTIAEMRETLQKSLTRAGFGTLWLMPPEIHRYLVVPLEVADDSPGRTAEQTESVFREVIKVALFNANWRLVEESVEVRLGLVRARVRGMELRVEAAPEF